MSDVTGITSSTAPAAAQGAGSTAKGLGADADTFLKLLVANLKQQNPMAPTDSSAFMQQMAQMSTVEQLTALADGQKRSNALALLGKTVSYEMADGSLSTGTVTGVNVSGVPKLSVGDVTGIDPARVTQVG